MATRRSSPVTNPAVKPAAKPGQPRPAERSPVRPPGPGLNGKPAAAPTVRTQGSPIHAPASKPKPMEAEAGEALSARLAKAALRRLVLEKLEPTPANYARAYQQEAGDEHATALPDRAQRLVDKLAARAFDGGSVGADVAKAMGEGRWEAAERLITHTPDETGVAWVGLMDRVVRGLERGGKQWTTARKKDSLQRVLSGSRSDAARLQQRLSQLLTSWETDRLEEAPDAVEGDPAASASTSAAPAALAVEGADETLPDIVGALMADEDDEAVDAEDPTPAWNHSLGAMGGALEAALPTAEGSSQRLAEAIRGATLRIQCDGMSGAMADEVSALCAQANRVVQHRHHLVAQLGQLCHELTASLADLTENDSWVQGQCEAMQNVLHDGLTARGVKSVTELLHHTRRQQGRLRAERERARDALKLMIGQMLAELSELGTQTGRFHESVGRYADVIEKADSLESLAGAVREMVEESRSVQSLVQQAQARLQSEHSKADELTRRVDELELELRRLSQEVSTDQLTQIANRRGLLAVFDVERARVEREGSVLSVGLLDIDNFKRLNDELGHSAGDEALKSLAAVVSQTLRPTDMVARYGGEEFVVLLPNTPVEEGQQILTRLQRSLSGGLFMHEQKQVFVTFSAGVTAYRLDERIEEALERADQALYEAKRTGKNRTCIG